MKFRINIKDENVSFDTDNIEKSDIIDGIKYKINGVEHHVPTTSISKIVILDKKE